MDATLQEIEQYADSRETSQVIMEIIFQMATNIEDVERLWQEPNPIEEITIIRRVTDLVESSDIICDGDIVYWGECSINVSTGAIS